MNVKDNRSEEAIKAKSVQKLISGFTAEAFRIATARFDNSNGIKTIFKRRGGQSGTAEAAEDALSDILLKEDLRK